MKSTAGLLAVAFLAAGCSGQQEISASDAREEVHSYARDNGHPAPDEDFYLMVLSGMHPSIASSPESALNRGYFGCHAAGQGTEVVRHWLEAVQGQGWTTEQAADVMSAAVASLCPWHLETLGN